MKDIIKAQLYQLRRDKLLKILFFVVLFLQITNVFGAMDYDIGEVFSGGYYLINQGFYLALLAALFGMLMTSQVCGGDFIDKTTNYELMAGHKRSEVYFGRTIISIVGGLMGTVIMFSLPMILVCVAYGFGTEILPEQAILRLILVIFPAFRMICEIIFLVYVIKNPYVAMVVSVLIFIFGQNISMFLEKTDSVFLGMTNIIGLFTFDAYRTYSAVTLEQFYIYNGSLNSAYIVETIMGSLIIGGVFLFLGYVFFKKDDVG